MQPTYAAIYRQFRRGARLRSEDVVRLMLTRGHVVSNNRLREFGRNSGKEEAMTAYELFHLIEAWADEQRASEVEELRDPEQT